MSPSSLQVLSLLLEIEGTWSEFPGRYRLDTIYDMNLADGIRAKVAGGAFEFSQHALDQSVQRRISVAELREAIARCEVIENYPDDKYGPSCLVLGVTACGRPLHVQCSHPSRTLIKIITLYEPDPALWQGNRLRRP